MRKLLVLLFLLMCIFSSVCSAKGYWTAVEPVAREDGTYHVSDQLPLGEGGTVWQESEGTYMLYFFFTHVMCSDDGNEIIVPIRARVYYSGTAYDFMLVKYKYSTRRCEYVSTKSFRSANYNATPRLSDMVDFTTYAKADFWGGVIEHFNNNILMQWSLMMNQNMLKRYEFVED